jgi:hypothetical protein
MNTFVFEFDKRTGIRYPKNEHVQRSPDMPKETMTRAKKERNTARLAA